MSVTYIYEYSTDHGITWKKIERDAIRGDIEYGDGVVLNTQQIAPDPYVYTDNDTLIRIRMES